MKTFTYLLLFCTIVARCGVAEEVYRPAIFAASHDGEVALQQLVVPDFLRAQLVAAEPLLANPVAFCFDGHGNLFVAETFRQARGVEDNRSHMNWLLDELQSKTVSDREAMIRKHEANRLEHYTTHHDRVRMLKDLDHDGVYETSTVFSDGYNQLVDGTGAGLLAIGGNVYYTCIPNLWKLQDRNNDGQADHKEKMHTGFGVRFAFRGHDLHGIIRGPDGRLYFSIGDRGYHVTTQEGTELARPDAGAIFRCWPDGSELEEFAYGLRNPQELAFDDYGNLFTADNNSDVGDEARWVYVCEHMDAGWRMYYQYLNDRGPWHRERMWRPFAWDEFTASIQPAYIVPPIANIGDGPSGLTYYPGWGLPERYAKHFFLADFRGTAAISGIRSFQSRPQGAGFELTDAHEFIWGVLATDVEFGFDGRLYVSDWVQGWEGVNRGRIYAFQAKSSELTEDVPQRMQSDFSKLSSQDVVKLLGHADRRLRMKAQFELADRGKTEPLLQVLTQSANQLARIHAIWGIGQIARSQPETMKKLIPVLSDSDSEIVAQAASILGDSAAQADLSTELLPLLRHQSDRVKYHAAMALGKRKANAADGILAMIAENDDNDPHLRHAGLVGLLGTLDEKQLAELSSDQSVAVRLTAVVALRRARSPLIVRFLQDSEERVLAEVARAINDVPIDPAMADLALLPVRRSHSEPLLRRILNANFRLGTQRNARNLIAMADDSRLPTSVQLEALHLLSQWKQPPPLDAVTNDWRPLPSDRNDDFLPAMLHPVLKNHLQGSTEFQVAALALLEKYPAEHLASPLQQIVEDVEQAEMTRQKALRALDSIANVSLESLLDRTRKDPSLVLRVASRSILVRRHPERAAEILEPVLDDGEVREKQAAIRLLSNLATEEAAKLIGNQFARLAAGKLQPELQLDVLLAGEKVGDPPLLAAITNFRATRNSEDALSSYRELLYGGDAKQGETVFFKNIAASCQRCHKVDNAGGIVGPELDAIGRLKSRDYLLESIVLPNKTIAKGFETSVLLLDTGRSVSGIIQQEDEHSLMIENSSGETISVNQDEIEGRSVGLSGMPDNFQQTLTESDIRDLVEYLSTLRKEVPEVSHGSEE